MERQSVTFDTLDLVYTGSKGWRDGYLVSKLNIPSSKGIKGQFLVLIYLRNYYVYDTYNYLVIHMLGVCIQCIQCFPILKEADEIVCVFLFYLPIYFIVVLLVSCHFIFSPFL